MPDVSHKWRLILLALALFSLCVAAGGLAYQITLNTHAIDQAAVAAQTAAKKANVAADRALAAHHEICAFLDDIYTSHTGRVEPSELKERIDARRVWEAYSCPAVSRTH